MEKNRIEKFFNFLLLLVETKSYSQKKQLIITASRKQLVALFEVVKNVLYGRLNLSSSYKKELASYASDFKILVNKKENIEKKRDLVLKKIGPIIKFISPISSLKPKYGS